MKDYTGPLREDFQWQQLEKRPGAFRTRGDAVQPDPRPRPVAAVAGRWGAEAMTTQAINEWMGSSPVYNSRIRALHGIEGDGVDVIMKGFQLDIGAPHMWLKFHFDVKSHDQGFFWLTSCGAYNGVRGMTGGDTAAETQICVHMEDPTFDATVMAVDRGALHAGISPTTRRRNSRCRAVPLGSLDQRPHRAGGGKSANGHD
ncbi:MAG: hypothetical protein IPG64_13725 [Haliea sp.]|nr:hypothetical protein [Haliea sp.]